MNQKNNGVNKGNQVGEETMQLNEQLRELLQPNEPQNVEHSKDKAKKPKSNNFLLVLFMIISLGLVGYIAYDKKTDRFAVGLFCNVRKVTV